MSKWARSVAIGGLCLGLAACAGRQPAPVELLGMPAPLASAQRQITLTPDTRWVNVEGGEIVAFTHAGRSFAWNFFVGATVSSFALNRVAPADFLDHPVTVYVAPDPRYRDLEGFW